MSAAKRGDLPALRTAIADRERLANLSNRDAADLAKVIAVREVRSPAKPGDAIERVHDVSTCAYEVDGALDDRMRTHDDAGADAALARLDSHKLESDDVRTYAGDANPHWRAVGARAMTRVEDRLTRQHLMQDATPRVRREAVRAATRARDAADFPILADVARLDPEPIVRTEAVRALATQPANPEIADRLRDLWVSGDELLREDIALAWAAPEIYANGGRDALRVIIASSKDGAGVLEAAAAVEMAWQGDAELEQAASARIVRAIESGPVATRLHAIAVARLDRDKDALVAIQKAKADGDKEVEVAALSRLAGMGVVSERTDAIAALEVIAGQARLRAWKNAQGVSEGDPGSRKVGARALFVLAQLGDLRVQQWLEEDLASKDAYDRLAAASALAALDRSARAAPLLADDDAMVRSRAACTLMLAVRGK